MAKSPDDPNVEIFSSGIDPYAGAEPPISAEELIQQAGVMQPDREEQREIRFWSSYLNTGQYGLVEGMDPDRLDEAGWGAVFAESTLPDVVDALRPLLEWRREQAGERYREFWKSAGVRLGESKNRWLARHGSEPGRINPERVPYYLLFVGSPEQIPFRFQSQFLQYAVGRLYFDTPEQYYNYAVSVVEAEKNQLRLPRRLALFNPVHEGDIATRTIAQNVTEVLAKELHSVSAIKGWVGENWSIKTAMGMEATRARLTGLLGGDDGAALLFTASHSLLLPPGSPDQTAMQGALVTADWPGMGNPVKREHLFAGEDLPPNAALWGSMAVLLTNYSLGTPQIDESIPGERQRTPTADLPFFARLPMNLLSHPRGGALAVIGTTGKLWVLPEERKASSMLRDVLARLMNGSPAGVAMSVCFERYAETSTALADLQQEMEYGVTVNRMEYVALWQDVYNARSMMLLGDPAVRLPVRGEAPEARDVEQPRPALALQTAQSAIAPEAEVTGGEAFGLEVAPPAVEAPVTQPSLDGAVAGVEVHAATDTAGTPKDAAGAPKDVQAIDEEAGEAAVEAPAGEETTTAPPVAEAAVEAAQQAPSRAQRAAESPYVGPRSFRIGEAFFFGRDREAAALLGLVIAERIVLLYSPSGAGKSSLLNARVVPDLVTQGFRVMQTIRVNLEPPREFSGKEGFNRYVYSALLSLEEGYPKGRRLAPTELASMTLENYLKRREKEEAQEREERRAQGTLPVSEMDRERVLTVLVLDQFEEIITTNPTDRAGRQAFFLQVGAALRERARYALFVMREDYIAAIDPYLRPIPTRLSNRFRLDLLSKSGAMEAIQKPAQAVGVAFEDDAAAKLVKDLCTINVQQPDGTLEPVEGLYVEPVQLQVVCSKLWQDLPQDDINISLEDVNKLGKTDEALSNYYALIAKDVAAKTGVRERSIRRWFDTRLITRQGIRGQVLLGQNETEGLPNAALRQLETFYLVRGEKRGGATWYELSHDRLLKPVRDNNEQWFGDHLSQLQRQAEAWQESARPDNLLLAGVDLDEAEQWAKENEKEMEPVERDFLAESIQAREELRRREEEAVRREQDAKRISRLATISTVFSVMAIVAGIIAAVTIITANRDRREAQARQSAQIALGSVDSNPQRALLYALDSIDNSGGVENAPPEVIEAIRLALPADRLWKTFRVEEGAIYTVAFNPDATRIATGDASGLLRVWDTASGEKVYEVRVSEPFLDSGAIAFSVVDRRIPIPRAVTQVAFTADGRFVAAAGQNGELLFFDAGSGEPAFAYGSADDGAVNAFHISAQTGLTAAGYSSGVVVVWDSGGRQVMRVDNPAPIASLAFSNDGDLLMLSDEASGMALMRIPSGEIVWIFSRDMEQVTNRLAFSPDGESFATANSDGVVWEQSLVDAGSFTLEGHDDQVLGLAYTPFNSLLASASADRTVRIWNTIDHTPVMTLAGHTEAVQDVAFSADGRRVASASADGTVRIWDITGEGSRELWTLPREAVNSVSYTGADGGRIAVGVWAEGLFVYDAATQREIFHIPFAGYHVTNVSYSPDGRLLAGLNENSIFLWNAADGRQIHEIPQGNSLPTQLEFSPDGTRLLTGDFRGQGSLWDAASGRLVGELPLPREMDRVDLSVSALAFHPTENWAATGYSKNGFILWDLDTLNPLSVMDAAENSAFERGIDGLEFTRGPEGEVLLISAGGDGAVRVHTVAADGSLEEVEQFATRTGSTAALAVWENRVAFGGSDRVVYVSRLFEEGEENLYGHTRKIVSLTFGADGKTLYSVSEDGFLRAHTLDKAVLVEQARQRIRLGLDDWQCQYYGLEACP